MEDAEPIAVSALQHWAYCARQCGWIHLEQVFDDNLLTQRGNVAHAAVDQPGVEIRKGVRVERALPIWSDTLGLIGKADAVEFERDGTPYPVEYKHGSRHKAAAIAACDDLQMAAQAICLEEMLGREVPEGAVFYATSKRRRPVRVTAALRGEVVATAHAVRSMLRTGQLPPPTADRRRCRNCSMLDRCQPNAWSRLHDESIARDLYSTDD